MINAFLSNQLIWSTSAIWKEGKTLFIKSFDIKFIVEN